MRTRLSFIQQNIFWATLQTITVITVITPVVFTTFSIQFIRVFSGHMINMTVTTFLICISRVLLHSVIICLIAEEIDYAK